MRREFNRYIGPGPEESLKIHLLSKGRYGGHWVDILSTHTNVDDIERVRLLRNEMQHSKAFSLDDVD
jgi:hypothetical protein